jgi:hypothetical protein
MKSGGQVLTEMGETPPGRHFELRDLLSHLVALTEMCCLRRSILLTFTRLASSSPESRRLSQCGVLL